ncbi:MAG: DNA polymerase/3'-5' exonuclease PolX [Planctomycetota bacterium]
MATPDRSHERLADLFDRAGTLLRLHGANTFRANAHAKAARTIRDHPEIIDTARDDPDALGELPGIGSKIAEKIIEFVETGDIDEFDELAANTPAGLLDVLAIPGLGAKTVRALWETLNVESIADLERVIDDGTILDVPRMGEKTVEGIRDAIDFQKRSKGRTPLGIALPIAESLVDRLANVRGVKRLASAGSLRRGAETIGDVDLLAVTAEPDTLRNAFTSLKGVDNVIASGETKSSIRLQARDRVLQVDLRIVPAESWGAALLYFTGSKEFNVALRSRAKSRGLTLNEYGLYPDEEPENPDPPQARGVGPIAGETEASIFEALEMPTIPPELREDWFIDGSPERVPEIITISRVISELHAHTTASDGKLSIVELAGLARQAGFHTIAVTDHSKSSVIAGGLDEDRLRAHIDAVRAANEEIDGITILAGSEVDILADGSLDYDDELLAALDHVVASPHASLNQSPADATRRLIRAIEHPSVRILGHPTGRLIGRREGFAPDIRALARAAAEHDVALELNANWMRLDLSDRNLRIALDEGALIAIDCDVHRLDDFEQLRFGIATARRAALPADRCVNCWDAGRLHAWLRRG